ncbi:MAG: hypothetical protein LW636_09400 [Planctomycetaceae bacterium]|nr:hypothetical protein [Planctomycetaceae bacterium]
MRRAREAKHEIARRAARILEEGRACDVDAAVDRALHESGLGDRAPRPSRAMLRAHAQGAEEERDGAEARRLRIAATLEEACEVLAVLEQAVLFEDPEGDLRAVPEVYGRAARGHFDLDAIVHVRVTTAASAARIARHLADAGLGEPECRSLRTRYGVLDQIVLPAPHAEHRILRIPPRMKVDPDRDVVRADRVEHASFSEVSELLGRFPTS